MQIRINCEHCDKDLPANSTEAMICSFDCTFCKTCVDTVLENVCPNCTGGFMPRPIRPKSKLEKYPVVSKRIVKYIDFDYYNPIKEKLKGVPPEER